MEVNDTPSALMSLPQVARYLAMKERTIYDWAQSGKIPAFKLGATWRFRQSEIDAWLETHRTGVDVSSLRAPLIPPAQPPLTAWEVRRQKEEAHQRLLEACREEIEMVIRDESRKVFVVDQFTYQFGDDVVREVVEQLRGERLIAVSELRGRDGGRVRVIERRN